MAFERPQGIKENVIYSLFIVIPIIIIINAFNVMAPPGSSRVLFGAAGGFVGGIFGYYFFEKTKAKPMKTRIAVMLVIWVVSIVLLLIAHKLKPIVD
jgi:membrane associated rhomboid family serine protease